MGEELLVTEYLSEQMISAGAKLIERLDSASCSVEAALWFFLPDEKIWRLIIASPLVKKEGPRKYYKRILDINKSAGKDNIISLNDISVSDVNDNLIQLFSFGSNSLIHKRFSKSTIDGVFIDDAYIYRMRLNS